jgi:hypothetical protein
MVDSRLLMYNETNYRSGNASKVSYLLSKALKQRRCKMSPTRDGPRRKVMLPGLPPSSARAGLPCDGRGVGTRRSQHIVFHADNQHLQVCVPPLVRVSLPLDGWSAGAGMARRATICAGEQHNLATIAPGGAHAVPEEAFFRQEDLSWTVQGEGGDTKASVATTKRQLPCGGRCVCITGLVLLKKETVKLSLLFECTTGEAHHHWSIFLLLS